MTVDLRWRTPLRDLGIEGHLQLFPGDDHRRWLTARAETTSNGCSNGPDTPKPFPDAAALVGPPGDFGAQQVPPHRGRD